MAGFVGAWQGPAVMGGIGAVLLLTEWELRRRGGSRGGGDG